VNSFYFLQAPTAFICSTACADNIPVKSGTIAGGPGGLLFRKRRAKTQGEFTGKNTDYKGKISRLEKNFMPKSGNLCLFFPVFKN
jgi:hypothetical protein